MNETATPSSIDNSILESPVPDPKLFLIYQNNLAYLEGKTARPHLVKPEGDSCLYWFLIALVSYVFFMLCGGIDGILSRIPSIQLPDLSWFPALPVPSITAMLLFLLILFLIGVGVVIRDWRLARHSQPQPPTAIKERAIATATPRPTGQVLDGVVVQAEKIVRQGRYGIEEKIGVRYQFAAPGGVITYGYGAGLSEDASHKMAPLPGTPVKVYYEGEKRHHLL